MSTTIELLALRLAPWALPIALLAIWQIAVVAGWLSVLGGDNTWFSFAARSGVIVAAFVRSGAATGVS